MSQMPNRTRRRLALERGLSMRAVPCGGGVVSYASKFSAQVYDVELRRSVAQCAHRHRTQALALDCALRMLPECLKGAA